MDDKEGRLSAAKKKKGAKKRTDRMIKKTGSQFLGHGVMKSADEFEEFEKERWNAALEATLGANQKERQFGEVGHIMGLVNSQGEAMKLLKEIQVTQKIEDWLQALEKMIKVSVSMTLYDCYNNFYEQSYMEWVSTWPTQFILAVVEIRFKDDLERALRQKSAFEIAVE